MMENKDDNPASTETTEDVKRKKDRDRCDLRLPGSLQIFTFQEGFCSKEWICRMMIALSSIGHPIKCQLRNLDLQPSGTFNTNSSQINDSEEISNLMSYDMSNIDLYVETVKREIFDIFSNTNMRTLSLGTADDASNSSQILPTLCK
ncbi:hypothetical protein DPMN_164133 [Dreissena polymorpha]|uniref:Uncharacterized protein n=1 Tax=Dreissena polymorpha TaxID=45954 RepID=A0A9D4IVU1_DREPO|nr:hypothetical protein DPMN_164133 [Dreissena polymorpha]